METVVQSVENAAGGYSRGDSAQGGFSEKDSGDLDLCEIIDRLKREKERSEGNFFETGRHDGTAWAKTAHYEDIQYALSWEDLENASRDSILGGYFAERIGKIKRKDMRLEGIDEYIRVYLTGWKKGLDEFWDEVKGKL